MNRKATIAAVLVSAVAMAAPKLLAGPTIEDATVTTRGGSFSMLLDSGIRFNFCFNDVRLSDGGHYTHAGGNVCCQCDVAMNAGAGASLRNCAAGCAGDGGL